MIRADLQSIPTILESRGYSAKDIAALMHGNWINLNWLINLIFWHLKPPHPIMRIAT